MDSHPFKATKYTCINAPFQRMRDTQLRESVNRLQAETMRQQRDHASTITELKLQVDALNKSENARMVAAVNKERQRETETTALLASLRSTLEQKYQSQLHCAQDKLLDAQTQASTTTPQFSNDS